MKQATRFSFAKLSAAISLAFCASPLLASPAGTVLFSSGELQIIDPSGVSRVGKAGDLLQPGERVVAPEGGICQVKMWDGSLIGLRPDSEIKFDLPVQASDRA